MAGAKTPLCWLVTRHAIAIHLGHTGEAERSGLAQSEEKDLYCLELFNARRGVVKTDSSQCSW